MEKYGYMGLAAVQIDRCDPCSLVWLDANELQNMVLALAKANYRSEQAYQREHDRAFPLWGAPVTSVERTDDDWLFDAAGKAGIAYQLLRLALRR